MGKYRLGLIVNPIAGMGGPVGLKGTDGDRAAKAKALGALPVAAARAVIALSPLMDLRKDLVVLTCFGEMGATVAHHVGLDSIVLSAIKDGPTTAEDTKDAAARIMRDSPELLLFVGGDGTARDLLQVVGRKTPLLGVPSGVKMHSAVFATTARAAGEVARNYLLTADRHSLLRDAEIMDREISSSGEIAMSPKIYGMVRTPQLSFLVPGAKSSSRFTEAAVLEGAVSRASEIIDDERISLIGPGSTMQAIKRRLGFEGTALGVDVVTNGRCLATDTSEQGILKMINDRPARIVISVVGGQGFLFGRGNQQLSARVIRKVGINNIVVVSSLEKLTALPGRCLLVDTGCEKLDDNLAGYMKILVGSDRTAIMPVKSLKSGP
jgi:predicted polyphosphate/ATP-dependent NAD kinase